MVGWFRRFCPLVFARSRRPPFFFSLAFSGFARSGPGVLVLCFLLLFCVPLLVSQISNLHPIFIFISFSYPCHPHLHITARALVASPALRCVCVERLKRCKTANLSCFLVFEQGNSILLFISYLEAGGQ